MVKIENEYGDRYKGKSSNAIYQGHYGRTIRRKSYKEIKNPSPSQVKTRNRFKEATQKIKELNFDEIQGIKKFYRYLKEQNPRKWPVNWYNFAKQLYIKQPTITILNLSNMEYQIDYLNIYKVQEKTESGLIVYDSGVLSNPKGGETLQKFSKIPSLIATKIVIIPILGITHEYQIRKSLTSLRFFDIRFFDNLYFT